VILDIQNAFLDNTFVGCPCMIDDFCSVTLDIEFVDAFEMTSLLASSHKQKVVQYSKLS